MDVRARAEIGSGHDSAGGLVAAADRPMGGVPDRPASERKGARLCDLRRTATVPQRFGSRQYRRVKPQSESSTGTWTPLRKSEFAHAPSEEARQVAAVAPPCSIQD